MKPNYETNAYGKILALPDPAVHLLIHRLQAIFKTGSFQIVGNKDGKKR
jgi:hypothetical protein